MHVAQASFELWSGYVVHIRGSAAPQYPTRTDSVRGSTTLEAQEVASNIFQHVSRSPAFAPLAAAVL